MAGTIRVAELFAGVGGFRLALDGYDGMNDAFKREAAGPFHTVWANQWEPPGTEAKQFAWRCYERNFGAGSCINENIAEVLDAVEEGRRVIPNVDMVVGGFPCQDYSVAKPLSRATGIEGNKGVLWWEIMRFIRAQRPTLLLFENVDRLLKSPAKQKGRDFAVMLSCLAMEGYSVEWRVINAADYGMPQKRRRVFIFGALDEPEWNYEERLFHTGVLAQAFPVDKESSNPSELFVGDDPYKTSESFGLGAKTSPFENSGIMQAGRALTCKTIALSPSERTLLKDVLVSDAEVPDNYFIASEKLPLWEQLRSAKSIERTSREGYLYRYTEGAMQWPDPCDQPSRTILTSEGGAGASRTKHAVQGDSGRIRRLVPEELEQLQMFPRGWTEGMSDNQRAFCMGNALVVEIPHRIGKAIASTYLTKPNTDERGR